MRHRIDADDVPVVRIRPLVLRTAPEQRREALLKQVGHRVSQSGRSRYTLRRLVRLWLNMFLNFSIKPLRVSVYVGLLASCLSVVALIAILIDKLWITPDLTVGIPTVLGSVVFFSGVQLMILGLVGEYLGRLYLDQTGTPQYIVRYSMQAGRNNKESGNVPAG